MTGIAHELDAVHLTTRECSPGKRSYANDGETDTGSK